MLYFILELTPVNLFNKFPTKNLPLFFVIIAGGIPLFIQIIIKLLKGNAGADLLAAIALITSVWMGQYLAATLIILMLASGQALETYAMRKASAVLRALAERMPSIAHRRNGGITNEIGISDIKIGDEIVIFPHELCPVDGLVIEGNGSMDESYLTGEPYNISKTPGTTTLSGAINGNAVLVIRAEKLPEDSRYAKIMEVMEEAEKRRPKLMRIGDRIGMVFAPFALIFAVATWYFTGEPIRFLSVLVVATPCPLLIAIPITIISAISMAARRGIIIKDPTVLEQLPTCKTAIFDKTGTLTYGKPELTEIIPIQGLSVETILQQIASLERYSKHPLATAIIKAAEKTNLKFIEVTSVSEKPGHGLTGTVSDQEIMVTSRKKLLESNPDILSILPPVSAGLECMVLIDGQYAATLRLRDTPRANGRSFIGHLAPTHEFKHIILLSGDRESEVNYLAGLLGIKETYSSQSPEQKVAIVHAENAKAATLFMGDGINDAPALAAATVGIAFGQHSSITSESAGAVIMDNTLAKVDELLHISILMRYIAMQSAIGGMLLSVICMFMAASGFLTPVMGALLQEFIDILAIINALRMTWQPKIFIDIKD